MFADGFSVVSIHCVARGLRASFLYKCPTLRGGLLRQHGLLVSLSFHDSGLGLASGGSDWVEKLDKLRQFSLSTHSG